MNPEVDQILQTSAAQLMQNVLPLLPEGYTQGHGSLLSFMMIMSAQEYERAADIRVAENRDMRALFANLAGRIEGKSLRDQLEAGAAQHDSSFAISALNKTNGDLRRTLIALQTHAETKNDREMQARIWEVLKRAAARRLVKLA